MTALHCAANYNSPEVVELLLNAKADPEAHDENESTSLHLAATTGSSEIVLQLLEAFEKYNEPEKLKQVCFIVYFIYLLWLYFINFCLLRSFLVTIHLVNQ